MPDTNVSPPETIKEVPDVNVSPLPGADRAAARENEAILSDDYADDGRRRDHNRQQGLKDAFYFGIRILVVSGIVLIAGLSFVWALHVAGPQSWRWLTKEETDHIQALLFSGAMSAALTLLGKKVF